MIVRLLRAEAGPPQGDAVLAGPWVRAGSALAGVLDLEDVGAVVAEDRGGQRAGEQGGDVDDPDPGQRGRSPAVRRCPGQRRCVGHPRVGHALIVLRRRRTCRAVDPRGSPACRGTHSGRSVPTGPETSRDRSCACAVHSSDCSAWRNRFPEPTPWSGLRHRSDTEFRLNSGTLCRGVEQYALEMRLLTSLTASPGEGDMTTSPVASQTIATVERAADVLTLFARADEPTLGVTEIAQALGLSKAAVHRILASLRSRSFVELDEDTRRYSLGPASFELGLSYLARIDVRALAAPELAWLSRETQETATLSVLAGDGRIYVDQVTPPREIVMSVPLGQRFPLHAGSSSKALLAFLPNSEVEDYLHGPLRQFTETTRTDPDAAARRPRADPLARLRHERRRAPGRAPPRSPHPSSTTAAVPWPASACAAPPSASPTSSTTRPRCSSTPPPASPPASATAPRPDPDPHHRTTARSAPRPRRRTVVTTRTDARTCTEGP